MAFASHAEAKADLQRRYFGMERPDASIPLLAFVGRITAQKGVHLILQSAEQVLRDCNYRCQFLLGGMASDSDAYGRQCAGAMNELRARHPSLFWADPGLFFTDGDLVNMGADFCLMPSVFEPGGIVQQEFFVAGTPVIAFKTGGLKDTVVNWNPATRAGNGFTFVSVPPNTERPHNRARARVCAPAARARARRALTALPSVRAPASLPLPSRDPLVHTPSVRPRRTRTRRPTFSWPCGARSASSTTRPARATRACAPTRARASWT
jgi:glycogen synthase